MPRLRSLLHTGKGWDQVLIPLSSTVMKLSVMSPGEYQLAQAGLHGFTNPLRLGRSPKMQCCDGEWSPWMDVWLSRIIAEPSIWMKLSQSDPSEDFATCAVHTSDGDSGFLAPAQGNMLGVIGVR